MKQACRIALSLAAIVAVGSVHAAQQDIDLAARQRVIEYVTQQYGTGTPLAAAALTYARAAAELWMATAKTQQYHQAMTQRAGIAEICLRGQMAEAGVTEPEAAIAELERTIASNEALYAGELYAVALAQQHPLDLAITPAQACRQSGVPLP